MKVSKQIMWWVIITLLLVVGFLFLNMALFAFITTKTVTWETMQQALRQKTLDIVSLTIFLPIALVAIFNIFYHTTWKKKNKAANIRRAYSKEYGCADFMINETNLKGHELAHELKVKFEPNFACDKPNEVGFVVKSKYQNGTTKNWISSCDANGHHCLVIGATSSGKTQKTILQTIAYNARIPDIAKKPSMVIFDPKGEIASYQANTLQENGYEVLVFNMRDTFKSSCWNPLYLATKTYFDAKLLEAQINYETQQLDQMLSNPNLSPDVQRSLMDKAKTLTLSRTDVIKKLSDADEMMNDIGLAIYMDKQAKDKFWQDQAKSCLLSIYYLMLETLEDQYIAKQNYPDINIAELQQAYAKINLPSIATELANTKDLIKYFKWIENLDDLDFQTQMKARKSYINGSSVFSAGENTLGSIMATVAAGLEQYKQSTVQNITTTNEIFLDQLTTKQKPVALFIIVPDEKENSYKFATLLIDQIYKASIALASSLPSQKLPRALMFLLDEFGNIPTIPKFDTMVTVSRSRRIYFCIAIQGFNQIQAKYGLENYKTIVENMLLHVFVSSTDQTTLEYYQKRAGTYTIYKSSVSKADGKLDGSSSTSLDKKELMTFDDIQNNPKNMLLIFYANKNVAWVKTDMFWECKDLHSQNPEMYQFNEARIFDFKDHYYSVLAYLNRKIKTDQEQRDYAILLKQYKQSLKVEYLERLKAHPLFKPEDIEGLEPIQSSSSDIMSAKGLKKDKSNKPVRLKKDFNPNEPLVNKPEVQPELNHESVPETKPEQPENKPDNNPVDYFASEMNNIHQAQKDLKNQEKYSLQNSAENKLDSDNYFGDAFSDMQAQLKKDD